MKKYINEENLTALVIVVIGVLLASLAAPAIQGLVSKFRKKTS